MSRRTPFNLPILSFVSGISLFLGLISASAQPDMARVYSFSVDQCSQNEMYQTCGELIGALQQLQTGDTIILGGGIYYIPRIWIDTFTDMQQADRNIQGTGTENAPITVKASPGKEVIFRGRGIFFYDTHHWTLDGIIFEDITNDIGQGTTAIVIGAHEELGSTYKDQEGAIRPRTVAPHNITIQNCAFRHGSMSAISIWNAFHPTVENTAIMIINNHFENLRSRHSGGDLSAVGVKYRGRDVTIRGNTFVDIGSDGVHLGAQSYKVGTDIHDIVIEDNRFWVERNSDGSVPYRNRHGELITKPCTDDGKDDWDENTDTYCIFTENVGENGIDIKRVNPNGGQVIVRENIISGFRPTIEDQDASGANGEGIVLHNDGRNVILERNHMYDNTINLVVSQGSGGSEDWWDHGVDNITIQNNLFAGSSQVDSEGLVIYKIRKAVVYHNTFVHHSEAFKNYSFSYDGQTNFSVLEFDFKNNVVVDGQIYISTNRAQYPGQRVDIDFNAWSEIRQNRKDDYVPALFQGNHDVGSHHGECVDLGIHQEAYYLIPDSPLIDMGTEVDVYEDYLGASRPKGDGFDIGAYEFSPWTFEDVPPSHWASTYIEALYQAGFTAGCDTDPLRYCPDDAMIRAESAVFVERGIHGVDYQPSAVSTPSFDDVPVDYWGVGWIESLWQDGYTAGCGADPLTYCPLEEHTRAEGCVFYLRMLHGADYQPSEARGLFTDVPLDWWGAGWVEAAYQAGLIDPCQAGADPLFCPNEPLTRAMAAFMMVQAKDWELP